MRNPNRPNPAFIQALVGAATTRPFFNELRHQRRRRLVVEALSQVEQPTETRHAA